MKRPVTSPTVRSQLADNHTKKKIDFQPVQPVKLASRDYGLVRVNSISSTPHPKKFDGVDIKVLTSRLEGQRANVRRQGQKYLDNSRINFGQDKNKPESSENISLGTPHPNKAVAINPKVLKTRIDEISRISTDTSFGRSFQKLLGLTSVKSDKIARKNSLDITKKKVTVVSPRNTCLNIKKKDLDSRSEFNVRRQTFNEGEFTIAKYGKKMSDQLMGTKSDSTYIDNELVMRDLAATQEIEMLIRRLGLVSGAPDQSVGKDIRSTNTSRKTSKIY